MDQYSSAFDTVHNPKTVIESKRISTSSLTIITCTITDLDSHESKTHQAVRSDRVTHPEGIFFENADSVLINPYTDLSIITTSKDGVRLPVNGMMSRRKLSTLKEIIFSKDGREVRKYSDFKVV